MKISDEIVLTDVQVTLEPGTGDPPLRPVIHAGTIRIGNAGFVKIVEQGLGGGLDLSQARIDLVSSRLIEGGAELVLRVRRSPLDQQVRTQVTLSPAGNGDLRITVTSMRVGILSAAWLLEFLLSSVNRYPGLRQAGPKAIDANLATLLRGAGVPVDLQAGVERVGVSPESLILQLSPAG